MSNEPVSTGTTRTATVYSAGNVTYASAAPRGSVTIVTPHPPSQRS